MSFSRQETSRFRGTPVELYYFEFGRKPGQFYAYTNADDQIDFEGVSYRPLPLDRDGVKTDGSLDKTLLNIRMPKTAELPELFRVYPPSTVVNCIIRQGHQKDDGTYTEFLVVFTGRIINCTRSGNEATVGVEPIQTSLRRTGLRQHYQYSCPHALYGPRCKAPKKVFNALVARIDGTTLTLVDGWNTSGQPEVHFRGGMVEWESSQNDEPRTILQNPESNVFVLSGFLRELRVGDMVQMVLGCPHDLRSCHAIHGNVLNFGGCAWIPFENPFGKNPF